jgi:hypothetical protein
VIVREQVAELAGIEARYVRLGARNYGAIPEWHPGHGDGAFIFVDEILIDGPTPPEGDRARSEY